MGKKITLLTTAAILASLAAVSVRVSADDTKGYTMYRVYNSNSGEHFYTKDKRGQQELINAGWSAEGTGWYAPESGSPVYRLYNKNAGDHHYTMSAKEKNELVQVGWSFEGIGWYSPDKGVALHRAYNPNAKAGSHNYTISNEEQGILTKSGWKDEGIAWYGLETKKPTFSGIKDSQFTAGQIFDDHQGIVAADFLGRKLDYTVSGTIDPMTSGQYELTYQVTDEWKQTTTMKRKIVVKAVDITQPEKPVLIKPTITGSKDITIKQTVVPFDTKQGISATDRSGKSLEVVVFGGVDTKRPGEYYLSYQATDDEGSTVTVGRKVVVEKQSAPIITGANNLTMSQTLDSFDPLKEVEAKDALGNLLEISVEGKVDEKVPGVYLLKYETKDQFDHQTTLDRLVTITLLPEPKIIGIDKEIAIYQTTEPFDLYKGVSAVDGAGRPLEVRQVDSVFDPNRTGLQQILYETRDAFGTLVMKSRTIHVLSRE